MVNAGKRKRAQNMTEKSKPRDEPIVAPKKAKTAPAAAPKKASKVPGVTATTRIHNPSDLTIQIITGSYDRILHGITCTLPQDLSSVQFADTFLFTAHTSAIKTLALSPPSHIVPGQPQKLLLASGATDARINLYHISAHPPRKTTVPANAIPSLSTRAVVENPSNRELGSLTHHVAGVTAVYFPTRGKLLSASEDSTIAVTRTRDWSLLSAIKAPIPKAQGRPSGDTAPLGGAPSGVNDFAVHPSLKLMLSVGKGEVVAIIGPSGSGKSTLLRCATLLMQCLESKHSSGEGRKVVWGSTETGEEFAVAFEWGVAVFGMDCKPRCKVLPDTRTKIHEVKYVKKSRESEEQVLVISTEDGRLLFFSTEKEDLIAPTVVEGKEPGMHSAKLLAQLGGKEAGFDNRIKDFSILEPEGTTDVLVVTGQSNGVVRLFKLDMEEVVTAESKKQVGAQIGLTETNNRVTCLQSFVMLPLPEGAKDEVMESDEEEEEEESSDEE